MPQLSPVILSELWPYMVVFSRVAGVLVILPGFSESYVLGRMRILLAIMLAVVITPVLSSQVVAHQVGSASALGVILLEFLVGLFIGTLSRIALLTVEIAGSIIGFQINLANASVFDPAQGQQGVVTGAFLNLIVLVMIFVMDLHHLMIRGMVESFQIISPGGPVPLEDISQTILDVVARGFAVAVQMSAPFIIIGTLYYLAIGLINRLLPQIQFFFVMQPLILILGMVTIYASLRAIMNVFFDFATPIFAGLR